MRYSALFCIALSYKNEKNYDLAIEYYMKALDETENDDLKKSKLYNNVASLYNSAGDKEKALYYNKLSFDFSPNDSSHNYGKLYIDNKILCLVTLSEIGDKDIKLDTAYKLINYLEEGVHNKDRISLAVNCLIESAKELDYIGILNITEELIIDFAMKEEDNSDYRKELEMFLGKILIAKKSCKEVPK